MFFRNASEDFRNLILGQYGQLPNGWPADWVYKSAFGDAWQEKIKTRNDLSPVELLKEDDLDKLRAGLEEAIGRNATDEEFVISLMHPKDAVEYIQWREKYRRGSSCFAHLHMERGLEKARGQGGV